MQKETILHLDPEQSVTVNLLLDKSSENFRGKCIVGESLFEILLNRLSLQKMCSEAEVNLEPGSIMFVEGGIACGKTTSGKLRVITSSLEKTGVKPCIFIEEPLNLEKLNEYIKDPKRLGASFQMEMVQHRSTVLKLAISLTRMGFFVVLDRSLYGDWVFAFVNWVYGNMTSDDYSRYLSVFKQNLESVRDDLQFHNARVVFIKQTLENCLNRLDIRNKTERSEESKYPKEYLELVNLVYAKYDALFNVEREQGGFQALQEYIPGGPSTVRSVIQALSELEEVTSSGNLEYWNERSVIENPFFQGPSGIEDTKKDHVKEFISDALDGDKFVTADLSFQNPAGASFAKLHAFIPQPQRKEEARTKKRPHAPVRSPKGNYQFSGPGGHDMSDILKDLMLEKVVS